MKKVMICLVLAFTFCFCGIWKVYASGEMDALLKLLVKKGVITKGEAESLKAEVIGKELAVTTSAKPVKGIKVGGKLEIRYQDSEGEEGTFRMANFEPNITVQVDDHFSMKGQLECTL